jgi:hypothetical protein
MRLHALIAVLATTLVLLLAGTALAASTNGSGGDMQAFYDCEVHTINFKQVSLNSSHSQINFIYEFPQLSNFLPVIDQITGGENTNPPPKNGFNPIWQLVYVTFSQDNLPANTRAAQIDLDLCTDGCIAPTACVPLMLDYTGMVFRCSVVGQKSPKGP